MMNRLLLLFFLFFQSQLFAQVSGIVIDVKTEKPLPFVNVKDVDKLSGTVTDINGKFSLNYTPEKLQFSFVGYETQLINVSSVALIVKLNESTQNLDEITILPGINPAHRIINNAIDAKKTNKPDGENGYSCKSFTRFVATAVIDIQNPIPESEEIDSSYVDIYNFLKKHHLFLMETASEKYYKPPSKKREKIMGTKISGIENPMFAALATQFQSFSFYDNYIDLFDQSYLSPLSPGSTNRYVFEIKDTTFRETDTVYTISFIPKPKSNFIGLEGLLFIHSRQWAIENVIATPYGVDTTQLMSFGGAIFSQAYSEIENNIWFPKQLKIELTVSSVSANGVPMMLQNVTEISDVVINPSFDTLKLGSIDVQLDKNATQQEESFWNERRGRVLDEKEKQTYITIDSISKENNLERRFTSLMALSKGKIRIKFIDVDLLRLFDFNNHEGFRLGLGLETNETLLDWMQFGGYFGYGFKDKTMKYGGFMNFNLYQPRNLKLRLSYGKDVKTVGDRPFGDRVSLLNPEELYSSFYIEDMDDYKQAKIELSGQVSNDIKITLFSTIRTLYSNQPEYIFNSVAETNGQKVKNFEIGAELNWAFNSKKIQLPDRMMTVNSGNPILKIRIAQGLKNTLGDLNYTHIHGRFNHKIQLRALGSISYQINGQIVFGEVPRTFLFYGNGTNKGFGIMASNTFETIIPLEFLSNRSAAFHFSYQTLPWKTKIEKWFRPNIEIRSSVGWGMLTNAGLHEGITFNTMEQGYFESGLAIHHLLRLKSIGLGVGVFYRYGPYALPSVKENFVIKLSLKMDSLL